VGALLALEAGAISGFLAARVLGQYEFPVLDPAAPARLLFVAPNLQGAARELGVDHAQGYGIARPAPAALVLAASVPIEIGATG
jgi:hypothetical protein